VAAAFIACAVAGLVYHLASERGSTRPGETAGAFTGRARAPFSSGITGARLTLGDGRIVHVNQQTALAVTERDGTTILVDSGSMNYHQAPPPRAITGRAGTTLLVDSGSMNYRQALVAPVAVTYNTISTSTGMEFPVTLSDGTRVYLNAETHLRFPTHFTGGTREIELAGEAFFEVASDSTRPFIVHAGGVATRVLGTSFNLRAYPGERTVAATLVEGKLLLARGKRQWPLAPGTQARYDKAGGRCEVRAVDPDLYTSWRSGRFIFRNERLEDVLGYLARWYGFEYEFADDDARDVLIGAHLNRYSDMDPIIRIIEETRLARVAVVPGSRIVIRSYK
jgi:ferric-dicitrate binding protein FerR (iron transport regulator)